MALIGGVLKTFLGFIILFLAINLFAKPLFIESANAIGCPYSCQTTTVCATANGMTQLTRFTCPVGTVCCRPALTTSTTKCTKGTKGANNTCKGIYKYYLANTTRPEKNNPTGLNFGDYDCDLLSFVDGKYIRNKSKVNDLIYQTLKDLGKASKYNIWKCIVDHESSHNALAFNPRSTGGTAWGMFQMDPNACYTSTGDIFRYRKTGNVVWESQISRALKYAYIELEQKRGISPYAYWYARRYCL